MSELPSAHQLDRFRAMLDAILPSNRFYRDRLASAGIDSSAAIRGPEEFRRIPFTVKDDFVADQTANPPYGSHLTYPLERYVRAHQTSGTKGTPLRWLDTDADWRWMVDCWVATFRAANVTPEDRIFFAFSFGPFIGFWCAYEAAREIGALALPGGGMNSRQRLSHIVEHRATVLCSTPTYALRLAEVAREDGIDLREAAVRATVHGGEPGAGIPATRAAIEAAWGAVCFDHAGATEVGPWGYDCELRAGLHLHEDEFICEVLDPETDEPAQEGELVVTNLGRYGCPVIRYRTGDRVRLADGPCACGRPERRLDGGVIGRIDDVVTIRGVSIYPSAIEDLVRAQPGVVEFAIEVTRDGAMDEMSVLVEVQPDRDGAATAAAIERAIRAALGLRVDVRPVDADALPRWEFKARRLLDRR